MRRAAIATPAANSGRRLRVLSGAIGTWGGIDCDFGVDGAGHSGEQYSL